MRDPVRRILGNQYDKSSPMKEFDEIKANGIENFVSNPPEAFLVPGDYEKDGVEVEMKFYLIENDDDKFIYMVRTGGRYFGHYFLYYWKKHSTIQRILNVENHLADNKRWTDTMDDWRKKRKYDHSYIRVILRKIGANVEETI